MNNLNFFLQSKYLLFFLFTIFFSIFCPWNIMLAEVMGSSSYKIQSDTVNIGGQDSSSASYNLKDTVGEVGTGDSNSANYNMHAGFWQMQSSYLAISSPPDLALASIGGLSYQASEGTISWTVTTDNPAGYSMSIASTTTPSLKSAFDSFADYTPAGSNPDYNFNNLPANSSFGFSPEGTEVNSRFKDNGLVCGTGSGETAGKCWDGLSTTPKVLADSVSSNQPTGSVVIARLRAETGADHIQTSGNYTGTIVVTVVTL